MALPPWLLDRWLAAAVLLLALVGAGAFGLLRSRRPRLALGLGLAALVLALLAAGGLGLSSLVAWWALGAAAAAFVSLAALLLLTGAWSRHAALAVAVLALVALGGVALSPLGEVLADAGRSGLEMRLKEPWWLALLALIPLFVVLGQRRLNRAEARPWVSLVLRCLLVALLALAMAEPYVPQTSKNITVLFVVDRSLSVPEELEPDPNETGKFVDRRTARVLRFINDAVAKRGRGHERDRAGLIVFGRRPRLELPPGDAPRFRLESLPTAEDGNYTDIGAALKLALASFPGGTAKRVVLISDGNENLGSAEEQANQARAQGVQIDVLPLAPGYRNEDEVLVEGVEAPKEVSEGTAVRINVLVRSFNPNLVIGSLTLKQITGTESEVTVPLGPGGELGVTVSPVEAPARGVRIDEIKEGSAADKARLTRGTEIVRVDSREVGSRAELDAALARIVAEAKAKAEAKGKTEPLKARLTLRHPNPTQTLETKDPVYLRLGLNPIAFERPLRKEHSSYSYEAEFRPRAVADLHRVDADGRPIVLRKGLPGDRIQNNRAATHVIARGQGAILVVENEKGNHGELVAELAAAGGGRRFKVSLATVDDLPADKDALLTFLSRFDCLVLANVPADRVSEEQRDAIRANTEDQGCGLVMIGGPDSYGAGGWQNTAVEKALPVDCDIRSLKVQGKGGLVLIMHASEMADGNKWQKKIAKLAIERLGPGDEVGVLDFSGFKMRWFLPMQAVGPNRRAILERIDTLTPGDMPDFDPALKMAHAALSDPDKGFAAKHVIAISDGDPRQNDKALLQRIRDDKITIAAVGVATHGPQQDRDMKSMASPGRWYKVDDPRKLPAIYIKETRLVSQSFVQKARFKPRVVPGGPLENWKELPFVQGYVRTTPKPTVLAQVAAWTPKFKEGQEFPLVAYWPYGLGRSVAFTSDAGRPEFWAREWVAAGKFAAFWESVVGWSMRPKESGNLRLHTEVRDGKVRVTVEARKENRPDTGLRLRGAITAPSNRAGKQQRLNFTQRNSGVYEAEVKAEEAGSYFVNVQAVRPKGKDKAEDEAVDGVRGGVTLSYSPEFAMVETNEPLLKRLAEITEGKAYADDDEALAEAVRAGELFRRAPERVKSALPFYFWLLFLAGGLLFLDVASRRLAFDPAAVAEQGERTWARLRGFPAPPPRIAESVGRLQARRPVGEEVARGRRFEGSLRLDVPSGADATAPSRAGGRVAERPETTAPGQAEEQPADFLERMLKKKKQVQDERDQDKP